MSDDQINLKLAEWMDSNLFLPLQSSHDAEAIERRLWEEGMGYAIEMSKKYATAWAAVVSKDGEWRHVESIGDTDPIAARRRAMCLATVKWLEAKGVVQG